jgi:hypothetical protein
MSTIVGKVGRMPAQPREGTAKPVARTSSYRDLQPRFGLGSRGMSRFHPLASPIHLSHGHRRADKEKFLGSVLRHP